MHAWSVYNGKLQTFTSWIQRLHFKTREVILSKLPQYYSGTFSTIKPPIIYSPQIFFTIVNLNDFMRFGVVNRAKTMTKLFIYCNYSILFNDLLYW
jgi:hypothetical protein